MIELLAGRVRADLSHETYRRCFEAERLLKLENCREVDRARSCTGRLLLHELLRRRGVEFSEPLRMVYGGEGKPALADLPEWHFNVSHSGDWVVCALARCPVGVDLQEERSLRVSLYHYFTPKEQEMLQLLPENAFFDLWAMKEAYGKCTGEGLLPVLKVEMQLEPPGIDREGYQAVLVPFPCEGLHLALCAQTDALPEGSWRNLGEEIWLFAEERAETFERQKLSH